MKYFQTCDLEDCKNYDRGLCRTENRHCLHYELKAENAELKARLEKAVELPVKVGDTAYGVGLVFGDAYSANGKMTRCAEYRITPHCIRNRADLYFVAWQLERQNDMFLTREAAEARLKELRGEE